MRTLILSSAYVDPAARGKLRALAGLGCAVTVLVPERWEGPDGLPVRTSWQEDGEVRIAPVPVGGSADHPDGPRWSGRAVRKLLRDAAPEIIQIEEAPWTRAAARALTEARRLRVPAVGYTPETIPELLPIGVSLRRRRVLRGLQGIVCANPLADALLAREVPDLPRVIAPRIATTPPLAPARGSAGGFVIGFSGRLTPEKGLDLLLRAAVRLTGRWSLLVSGTGPAQLELEALAERLGIAARVHWLGAQPRVERDRLWVDLDCFVAPSRGTRHWVETHAPSVVTAMAHGVPVVVAHSGALPSIVDEAGIVVPEDDVSALADTLQHLLDAPKERAAMGARGRRRAMAVFSDEAVARRLLEFWRTVASPHAAAQESV
jgi:glycosyltransferase involved in cell wall biosynthesis